MPGDDQFLVSQGITVAFADQLGDVRIGQKEFVHPRDLREHLEVSDIGMGEPLGRCGGILL